MILENIGEVLTIDPDELGHDKRRRLKLLLDVRKPLRRFKNIKTKLEELHVNIQI